VKSRRRSAELGLIVLASLITAGAYLLSSLGQSESVPANIVPFLGIVIGLLLFAHLANRWLAPRADPVLLPLAALLNGLGYVMIARLAGDLGDDAADLPGLQANWVAFSIAAYVGVLMLVRRVRSLEQYRYIFAVVGLFLLIVPLIPGIGREINGARIWASIGPVNFQPGEFAKLCLAIFFAAYLTDKRELLQQATFRVGRLRFPEPRHLGPILLAWGLSVMVMISEKDLGSSLLFFAMFVVLLWVATEKVSYVLLGTTMFAAGAFFAWSQFAHVKDRVSTWIDPWSVAKEEGFQTAESAFALADGGLTGSGLGLGEPDRIPEVETDFIFVAIGEELGLLGATAILVAYLLIIGSGLRIAVRASRTFEKLLAVGLTTLVGVQAFIIIGGVIRLVPLTGITLPFVSYGGSSLLANYVLLALLIRLSDEVEGEAERVALEASEEPAGSVA
jgi:cell division protein FtsW (lipid II flippase)